MPAISPTPRVRSTGWKPRSTISPGRGYQFAVCTNKLEWLSKQLLDQLGLSARFAAICGADTFGVSKPDPAILQQTVARAGGAAVLHRSWWAMPARISAWPAAPAFP